MNSPQEDSFLLSVRDLKSIRNHPNLQKDLLVICLWEADSAGFRGPIRKPLPSVSGCLCLLGKQGTHRFSISIYISRVHQVSI